MSRQKTYYICSKQELLELGNKIMDRASRGYINSETSVANYVNKFVKTKQSFNHDEAIKISERRQNDTKV